MSVSDTRVSRRTFSRLFSVLPTHPYVCYFRVTFDYNGLTVGQGVILICNAVGARSGLSVTVSLWKLSAVCSLCGLYYPFLWTSGATHMNLRSVRKWGLVPDLIL